MRDGDDDAETRVVLAALTVLLIACVVMACVV